MGFIRGRIDFLKYFEVFDSLVTTDRLKKIFASAEVDKLEESTSGHCIHVHVSLPGFVKTDDKYFRLHNINMTASILIST